MNFYNDNDRAVCEWLRELIAAGEIPPGVVDDRSIADVKPEDLAGFVQCHFFAGVGGWPLALRWAGLEGVAGIWTGSCPCQPLSCAGKRQGHADERHLWPAFHALIAECRPAAVFGEQVASKDGREWFAGVRLDLEGLGYAVGGADLCAAGVGAPHRRQRIFWVADAAGARRYGAQQSAESETRDKARVRVSGAERGPCGLADVQCAGLEGLAGDGCGGRESGRVEADAVGHAAKGGEVGTVAAASNSGHGCRSDCAEWRGEPVSDCGMGDATGGGCGVGGDEAQPGRGGYAERAGWSDFDILKCRDGKARRAESGTFPLVDGVPRGVVSSGDPSVSEAKATAFVRAWLEG